MASEEEKAAYSEESAKDWDKISYAANDIAVEQRKRAHIAAELEKEILALASYAGRELSEGEGAAAFYTLGLLKENKAKFEHYHANLVVLHSKLDTLLRPYGGFIPPFVPVAGEATLKRVEESVHAALILIDKVAEQRKERIKLIFEKLLVEHAEKEMVDAKRERAAKARKRRRRA